MPTVAVTGAAGPVGRRVVAAALRDDTVTSVVAVDREPLDQVLADVVDLADPRLTTRRFHLADGDLDACFSAIDVVCHLAGSDPPESTAEDHDLHTTSRVLEAARRAGVGHLIARTSATVYGAWPDNPVPLSETAPIRPNGESTWVRTRASIEDRLGVLGTASDGGPDSGTPRIAVLRPCVVVSEQGPDELGRVLAAARIVAPTDEAPPAQFVHADDVASAVDAIRRAEAEGIYNVAPDGALDAGMVRALVGGGPRFPLPEALARRLTALGWRYQLAPTPPGFVPFVVHPWVVANDRLRTLGWEPSHTNEEAFVAGHAAAPWASISPQRRQELALGAAALAVVGAAAGGVALVRRALR